MSDSPFLVRRCHDRRKIEVTIEHDEINYLDLEQVDALILKLKDEKEAIMRGQPPAPSPIDWSSEYSNDKKAKEWASTGECQEKYRCSIYLGGYECSVDQAMELYRWLGKTLKYHSKGKGKHD